jgi:hypothetical protein
MYSLLEQELNRDYRTRILASRSCSRALTASSKSLEHFTCAAVLSVIRVDDLEPCLGLTCIRRGLVLGDDPLLLPLRLDGIYPIGVLPTVAPAPEVSTRIRPDWSV